MRLRSNTSRPNIILMIGDEGALAVSYGLRNEAISVFAAEKDRGAAEKIFALLERNPRVPLTLFADTLAQDFRRETVPRLSPLDRPKLIERRLKQAFPQAILTASLPCRNDRTQVLLAGVHGDGSVFDWLEKLRTRCPSRVPRIALLPVECADMLSKLVPDAAEVWAMLLTRQRTGGFRQIVTHKGELVFARLTPPLPLAARATEIAEAIARDIRASLDYLGRLGLADAAELRVALLMPESAHAALKLLSLPVHSLRLFTPHRAALELGLRMGPEPDDMCSDRLYAGWLAQKRKPRLPLMPHNLRQARRTTIIREWGWRTAAAALLLAFVMTGWQAGDLLTTLFTTRQESAQLAELRQKLADEQATAAPITEPLGRLRQAIQRRRIFSEPVSAPWAALRLLDTGLGGEARIVKLDWHSENGNPANETLQVDVRFPDASANGDREAVVARFQKLAKDIAQKMPGYDVRLTRYPFPALPDEALSNENGKNLRADYTAELTVRKVAS